MLVNTDVEIEDIYGRCGKLPINDQSVKINKPLIAI